MTKNKNIFLKSTFILLLSGFFTKILGFIIRIVYTRIIGEYGISLLSIATPTYSLLITIATLAIPISVAKLVSENKKRSIGILSSAASIILITNLILIIIILLSGDFIASNLLKTPNAKYLLIAMSLTLPFVSMSSVLKGYFAGKQNLVPQATSNVFEQIIRLLIIILVIPKLIKISIMHAVIGLILLTIVSEISSIIIFFFFLPKKINFKNINVKPNIKDTKNILDISIPTVSGRIIGNIGYFFEPIILTHLLLLNGYSNNYILTEYGIYNAYTLTLLTMPSFFITAISTSLLPEVSKLFSNRDYKSVKKRIKQGLIFALLTGLFFSSIIFIFRNQLLFSIYKTTKGANYIRFLAPFFVLFYLEGILTSSLQALNKAKVTLKISFLGVLIKLIVMSILTFFKCGIYSLVIAEIINIIFVVFKNYYELKKVLKKEKA